MTFRKVLATVLLFILCGCGESPSDRAPVSEASPGNGKILSGVFEASGTIPVVQIITRGPNGSESLCTGSIVSPTMILTAKHCGARPGATRVIDHTLHDVLEFYDAPEPLDLTLLRTDELETEPFTLAPLQPPSIGERLRIYGYGWGELGIFGSLRSGDATVDLVGPTEFTSFRGGGESVICFGDSGGPVVRDTAGVLSVIGVSRGIDSAPCEWASEMYFTGLHGTEALEFLGRHLR